MISDYLPILHAHGLSAVRGLRPPKEMRRLLHQANEKRNDIVHKGDADIPYDALSNYLDTVNDFLYLLDVYSGREWARDLISPETLVAMDEEANQDDR